MPEQAAVGRCRGDCADGVAAARSGRLGKSVGVACCEWDCSRAYLRGPIRLDPPSRPENSCALRRVHCCFERWDHIGAELIQITLPHAGIRIPPPPLCNSYRAAASCLASVFASRRAIPSKHKMWVDSGGAPR